MSKQIVHYYDSKKMIYTICSRHPRFVVATAKKADVTCLGCFHVIKEEENNDE